jgi:hypothetical protein
MISCWVSPVQLVYLIIIIVLCVCDKHLTQCQHQMQTISSNVFALLKIEHEKGSLQESIHFIHHHQHVRQLTLNDQPVSVLQPRQFQDTFHPRMAVYPPVLGIR